MSKTIRGNHCIRTTRAAGNSGREAPIRLPKRKAVPAALALLGLLAIPLLYCDTALAGVPAVTAAAIADGTSPTGGRVVAGRGSIVHRGLKTIINQSTSKLALNWQTFNVGKDATVQFNQPSVSAVALNRILDQNPSHIFGHINSNGQVFLINTHGIIFGATAQLNVGGLVASTLDLTPSDFLANHFNLDAHGGHAGIVNHGIIEAASGGSVTLVGGHVANDGVIVADLGHINLDGANQAVLDFDGNGLIGIRITGKLKQRLDSEKSAVSNSGQLRARDGTVVLQASATRDLFTNLVNNSGVIKAGGISSAGGVVRLVATGGNTIDSGSIDVSGTHGGSVQLLSDRNVGVTGSVNVSGTHGGGRIRVGGGWQGGEGLPTAAATYVGPDARLNADATQSGDGGSVVVWGNQANNFYGGISARGGARGGDGGRVETSSHYGLNAQGKVDAAAPLGQAGTWLLDPYDVTISNGTDTNTGTSPDFTATATGSVVNAGEIGAALTTNTNVFVFTGATGTEPGNITVSNPITAAGSGNLYLEAAGSIFVNADIKGAGTSNPLGLYLWANYGGAAAGTAYGDGSCVACGVVVGNAASATIATDGGNVDIQTGGSGTGGVSFGSGSNAATINTGTGNLTVNTAGAIAETSGSSLTVGGASNFNATNGAITLGSTGNNFTGAVDLINSGANDVTLDNGSSPLTLGTVDIGGTLSLTYASLLTLDGNVTLHGPLDFGTPVQLGNDVTLTTNDNAVTFDGAVDNATSGAPAALTVTAGTGAVTFSGAVGGGANGALDSLTATGGSIVLNGGSVTTTNAQTYNGAVVLNNNGTFTTTNGAVDFNGTLDSAGSAGESLTVTAGTGDVTFGDAVGSAAGGKLGALTLNGTGATGFGSTVQAASLSTGTGTTTLGGSVTTSGTQAYNGAVLLGSGMTLTTTNSAVTFAGAVDNATSGTPESLTITAGTGAVTFGGAVGGDTTTGPLGALTIGGTGAIGFDGAVQAASLATGIGTTTLGGNVTTSGGAVDLGGKVALNGSAISIATTGGGATGANIIFGSTVDNASSTTPAALTVDAGTGNVSFNGAVGGGTNGALDSLTATGGSIVLNGGSVTTASAQTYNGAVVLNNNGTFTTTNGAVDFNGTLDSAGSAGKSLTVTAGTGDVTFGGAVGSAAGGKLGALTLNGTGATGFGSTVQAASLATGTGTTTLGGSVTTSGTQAYNGAVLLGSGMTLTTTNSAVTFAGAVDNATSGTPEALTVDTGTGNVSFTGAVGGGADGPLGALALKGSGTAEFFDTVQASSLTAQGQTRLHGAVITSGVQSYGNTLYLFQPVTLKSNGGAITFADVGNQYSTPATFTVDAGTGTVAFNGAVCATGCGAALGLDVTATGGISEGSGGEIHAGLASSFDAGTAAITLANSANDFQDAVSLTGGATKITNTGALTLGTVNVGSLQVKAGGAITQAASGSLKVGGTSTFDAGNHAITLANAGNDFTGAVSLNNSDANAVTLDNGTNPLVLGTSTIGSGDSAISGQGITQTGTITQLGGGGIEFDAGAGVLTLDSTGNNLTGVVQLTNSGANAVTLDNGGNSLQLGNSTLGSGVVTVTDYGASPLALMGNITTTGGAVKLDGAVNLHALGGGNVIDTTNGGGTPTGAGITITGDVNGSGMPDSPYSLTLSAGTGGAVTLGGALGNTLALGNLTATGGTFSAASTLNVASNANAAGNLSIATTAGAIAQNGAWSVGGTSNFDAGNNAITLGNTGNDFTGAVSLSNSGVNDVTLDNGANPLTLGDVSVGTGKLTLTGAGIEQATGTAIIQAADAGTATFNAGSHAITLANTGNDLTGAVSLNNSGTNAVTLDNGGHALTLGTLSLGTGALTLTNYGSTALALTEDITTSGGAVTFGGAVTVGGTDIAIDTTGAGTATGAGITFGGAVNGDTANSNSLTLTAGTGMVTFTGALGDTTALENLTTTSSTFSAASTLDVAKDLSITTTGGAIGQNAAWTVGGTSSFAADSYAIDLGNSDNDFTGAVALTGGTTLITSSGALTLGTLDTGALTATSTGALDLGTGTVGGALSATSNGGAITQATDTGDSLAVGTATLKAGNGAITLANTGNDFENAVTATGAGVSITDKNDLDIAALTDSNNGSVNLIAGSTLTGVGAIDAGTGAITLTANGGSLSTAALTGGNIALTGRDGIVLSGNVNATGMLGLTSTNAPITQSSGTITATGTTEVNAGTGTITLGNLNDFKGAVSLAGGTTTINNTGVLTLGALKTGALSATSTGGLNLGSGTVGGTLQATSNGGAITQATGTGDSLTVKDAAHLDADAGSITLANTGNDFEKAVTASGAGVSIKDKNDLDIAALTDSNNGSVNLTAGGTLTGVGSINAGIGDITLVANGGALTTDVLTGKNIALTGKDGITLGGNVTAGDTLTLTSGSSIDQNAGAVIKADTLTGSSAGVTSLTGNNAIAALGDFTAKGFGLTDVQTLTVAAGHTVDGGSSMALTTTGTGSNLTIDGTVQGTATSLASSGTIGEGASGVVKADTLTGSSSGATTLAGANLIGALGGFNADGFSLTNNQTLTVAGPLHSTGSVDLQTTTGDLAINGAIDGTDITLTSAGALTQGGAGSLTTAVLTGSSGGDTVLDGANHIGTLTAFDAANFSLTNAQSLIVAGPLQMTSSNGSIDLTTTTGALSVKIALGGGSVALNSADDLQLTQAITGTTVTLSSQGDISQGTTGIVTADTLNGSSAGATTLTGVNKIGALGNFSAGTTLDLKNAQALGVSGSVTAKNLILTTDGALTETGSGTLSADTLTGSAQGAAKLDGANRIGTLVNFDAQGLSFTNAQGLTVSGNVDGGNSTALTTTHGGLTLDGMLSGTTTTLHSAGAIKEGSTGSIAAAILAGDAKDDVDLGGSNRIGTLNSFSAANFSLADAQSLAIDGTLSAAGGAGDISLTTSSGAMTVNAVLKGTVVALDSASDLVLNNRVNGGTVTLKSAGSISQTTAGGVTASVLSGTSHGRTLLDQANHIGTLKGFTAGGGFNLTNAGGLTVAGPVNGNTAVTLTTTSGDLTIDNNINGATTTLNAAGAIKQRHGVITAATLSGHSGAATTLANANHIDTLGRFKADGFSLTNNRALTLQGPLDGGSSILLKTTAGGLTINGTASGKTVTLISAGAIDEGAQGGLTAATLTGSSVGATTLDPANYIGTLGDFSANGFTLLNAQALIVDGTVNGGPRVQLGTTSGGLSINGAVNGQQTRLNVADAIQEGSSGSITAATLSGSAGGKTTLGSARVRADNHVSTLGNFSSPAGFSLTNDQTLTLASVDGSAFAVDAGTADLYLAVTHGDLLQDGTTWSYDGRGTWSSSGHIGLETAPIYVTGITSQEVAAIGLPPAYFYAVARNGSVLPITGSDSVNILTSTYASRAQSLRNTTDSYIDPSVFSAHYRPYGIVNPGIQLPPDQLPRNDCQQSQTESQNCLND